jgi:hypothetical protein
LVKEKVFHTLGTVTLAIALATSITFLSEHMLNEDEEGQVEVLKGKKLHQVMESS